MGGRRRQHPNVFRPVPGLVNSVDGIQALARLATELSPTSWAWPQPIFIRRGEPKDHGQLISLATPSVSVAPINPESGTRNPAPEC